MLARFQNRQEINTDPNSLVIHIGKFFEILKEKMRSGLDQ
jgi:hypothetical protein